MDKFDELHQFTRADVNLLGPDRAMMLEVKWTKTLQFRQRVLRVPVLPVKNKAVCPSVLDAQTGHGEPWGGRGPTFLD